MAWEVQALSQYTNLLKDYSNGLVPGLDTGYVLEIRNTIHYHVMNLPCVYEMIGCLEPCSPKYEACRLGLVTYSLLVLFPVPLMTEPYPDLAKLLRLELDLIQLDLSFWMPDLELLLWLLLMGGIAALGTDDRWWYVRQVHWLIKILEITSWEHLKVTMASVLWLDSPCDFEGLAIWEETQMLEV